MATMQDIADRLGVSVSTVSKGLNGGKDISEELRTQILDTAVELGYTSRSAKKRENGRLALFVENMDYESADGFGSDIVMGFRQAANRDRYQVEVFPLTKEFQTNERYDHWMLSHKYAAAYILGLAFDSPWMEQLQSTSIPTALLDNFIPANPNVAYVGTDNDEAVEMAIEHLHSLGHEKIAFLNGSRGSRVSDQRMYAYLNSMARRHLRIDPNLAVYDYFVPEVAKEHVPAFVAAGATAILCGNDLIASGVTACLAGLGLSVPGDVSVIGFDDLPLAEKLTPPLTTIRQNRTERGRLGYYTLYAMLGHVSLAKNLLHPALIIRESTAVCRPRIATRHTENDKSVLAVNPQMYSQFVKSVL